MKELEFERFVISVLALTGNDLHSVVAMKYQRLHQIQNEETKAKWLLLGEMIGFTKMLLQTLKELKFDNAELCHNIDSNINRLTGVDSVEDFDAVVDEIMQLPRYF